MAREMGASPNPWPETVEPTSYFPANSPPLTTYIARECNGVDPRMFYHSGAVVQAPLTANSLLPILIKQAVVGWLGVRHAVVAAPKLGQGL